MEEETRRAGLLPDELWDKILGRVDDNSVTAFACVCKQLRRVQRASGRKLKTDLSRQYQDGDNLYKSIRLYETRKFSAVSEAWCLWSMSSLTVKDVWENLREALSCLPLRAGDTWMRSSSGKSKAESRKVCFLRRTLVTLQLREVAWRSSSMHTGTNCFGMNGLVLLQLMGSSKSAEILTRAWM